MARLAAVMVWIGCFLAIFTTPYTLTFIVLTALATAGLFLFPITYPTQEAVKHASRQPLTLLRSPLIYMIALLTACLTVFFGFV